MIFKLNYGATLPFPGATPPLQRTRVSLLCSKSLPAQECAALFFERLRDELTQEFYVLASASPAGVGGMITIEGKTEAGSESVATRLEITSWCPVSSLR